MSDYKRRISTLKTLIAGSVVAGDPSYNMILGELNEVYRVNSINPKSRCLILQVLHSTRALDSTLKAYIKHYIRREPQEKALGKYFDFLANNNISGKSSVFKTHKVYYKKQIADRRNHYMHQAGAFPTNDSEIMKLLSDMHACLSILL